METENESIRITRLFQEIMQLIRHNMSKMSDDSGMSAPQGMVLMLLSKHKKMKITELSSKLFLSNSTVSGIVDRLEKQSMVIRERSEDDKRVVYVSISPKYEDCHKNFHEKLEKNIEKSLSTADPEELHKIFEGLDALKRLLNDQQNQTAEKNGDDIND